MDPNADTYRMNEEIDWEEKERMRRGWEVREGSDERIGRRRKGEKDWENRRGRKIGERKRSRGLREGKEGEGRIEEWEIEQMGRKGRGEMGTEDRSERRKSIV